MKKLLIATRNNYKKKQFSYLFEDTLIKPVTVAEKGLEGDPVEDKSTPEGNALKKARFFAEKSELPVLGDDSGLEIDALGGKPGIKARRWGGKFSEEVSDEKWLNHLLDQLKGVSLKDRTARFNTCWALVLPNGEEYTRSFNLEFVILKEPNGDYPDGSPLSAVRYFPKHEKVETELSNEKQWDELKKELDKWNLTRKLRV